MIINEHGVKHVIKNVMVILVRMVIVSKLACPTLNQDGWMKRILRKRDLERKREAGSNYGSGRTGGTMIF
jgi:hypothetical protein